MIDEKLLIKELEKRAKLHEKDAEELNTENFSCDSEELFLRLADETCACIEVVEEQPQINAWIPCSERLPEKRDWYLAVFKEPDTGFIGLPYIADYLMGNHTAYTTKDGWIIKDCTDRYDCESLYHKNLECVAWMPLPEPYKGGSDND